MLKLTTISQEPVYISPSDISGLFQNSGFTEMLTTSGQQLDVQEDADYIYRQATRMQSFKLRQEQRRLENWFNAWLAIGIFATITIGFILAYVLFPCDC